jgi:hypothetical protein
MHVEKKMCDRTVAYPVIQRDGKPFRRTQLMTNLVNFVICTRVPWVLHKHTNPLSRRTQAIDLNWWLNFRERRFSYFLIRSWDAGSCTRPVLTAINLLAGSQQRYITAVFSKTANLSKNSKRANISRNYFTRNVHSERDHKWRWKKKSVSGPWHIQS